MSIDSKIICAGFGGQGVMLMGQLLAYAATAKGLETVWFPSYGPETRGGTANCSVTISESRVNSPVISKADVVVAMNAPSLDKFESKIKPGGIVFVNSSIIDRKVERTDIDAYYVPINDIAAELGNPKVINVTMLGAILKVTGLFENSDIMPILKKYFGEKKAHLLPVNEQAIEAGKKYIESNY